METINTQTQRLERACNRVDVLMDRFDPENLGVDDMPSGSVVVMNELLRRFGGLVDVLAPAAAAWECPDDETMRGIEERLSAIEADLNQFLGRA